MHTSGTAYCCKCGRLTPHVVAAKYDHWGALSKSVEKCSVCLAEDQRHEAPAADPPPVTSALSDMEIARGKFIRRLIARGVFSDYPHEPGVWG